MIGSLARNLMQKTMRYAGDAAKPVTVTIVGPASYDPETGTYTATSADVTIGSALLGMIAEAEVVKYKLTSTTHKATIAMLDYESAGSPTLPDTNDRITINGKLWLVEKVRFGSMNQSITLYVCEA